MQQHAITMLGTGLIGDFYTMTLHGQRRRDSVRVVYSRSAERGEVAFGYRTKVASPGNGTGANGTGGTSGNGPAPSGVVVNPAKSRPVTFAADDRIIVLAEG